MRLILGQGAVRLVHRRLGDLREHSGAEVHLPCEHMLGSCVDVRRQLYIVEDVFAAVVRDRWMPLSSLSFASSGLACRGWSLCVFDCRLQGHELASQPCGWIHADFVSSFLLVSEELSVSRILMPSLALCGFLLRVMRLEPQCWYLRRRDPSVYAGRLSSRVLIFPPGVVGCIEMRWVVWMCGDSRSSRRCVDRGMTPSFYSCARGWNGGKSAGVVDGAICMIPEADGEAETTVFLPAFQRLAQFGHLQD